MNNYQTIFDLQYQYFIDGKTLDLKGRIDALRSLGNELTKHEKEINDAIFADLGKSGFDLFTTEISGVQHEIKWLTSKIGQWTRPVRVRTNLVNLPGRSRIRIEPYGNTLVIGTWNYPFLLNLKPAVSSVAAGNVTIIKPSEYSPHSSEILGRIVSAAISQERCSVILGGVPEVTELLKLPFDKIFFTGGTNVGKLVMKAGADNLASVTLELGGKSPAIILPDAPEPVTARRISWGKFLNAGQTCIAPDYILVHESVADDFIDNLATQVLSMYGPDPSKSEAFGRIVNQRHFSRLMSLIEPGKTVIGGTSKKEDLFISPTVLYPVSFSDPVMQEEIFGPVLPVIPYSDLDGTLKKLKSLPKPLSLYVFSKSRKDQEKILSSVSFGGGCVNDSVMHIANPYLPFGGVGPSGSGRYHGRTGILEFSNQKSVMYKATWIDPFVRYPPFTALKKRILRKLL